MKRFFITIQVKDKPYLPVANRMMVDCVSVGEAKRIGLEEGVTICKQNGYFDKRQHTAWLRTHLIVTVERLDAQGSFQLCDPRWG